MRRFLLGVTLVGALAAATSVRADGPEKSEKLQLPLEGAQTPTLVNVPSNDQMQREYPRIALAMSLGGQAQITCTVETTGLLDNCSVDSDSPPGMGFGAAALRLASYFTAKPNMLDGRPVTGQITIPIRFQTGPQPSPPKEDPIPPPTSPRALELARELLAFQQQAAKMQASASRVIGPITAQVVAGGDAAAGEKIFDAYRLAVADTIAREIDERARLFAATMTVDQLSATLAYLKTPAGVAYKQAQDRIDDPKRSVFWRHVGEAARARLCAEEACPAGSGTDTPGQ